MHALPLHERLHVYFSCCGKIICCGCDHQHSMKSGKGRTCAFCREPFPRSDDEYLARLSKRVELKDPVAVYNMSAIYGSGKRGMSMDRAKGIGLLRESAELGCTKLRLNSETFTMEAAWVLNRTKKQRSSISRKRQKAVAYFHVTILGVRRLQAMQCVTGECLHQEDTGSPCEL